jgi:CubicO group peptidase (beta-lactamase class C family)
VYCEWREIMKKVKFRKQKRAFIFVIPILFLLIVAMGTYWVYTVLASKNNQVWPTNEWNTTTPESAGVDSTDLAKLVDDLHGKNVHSFVVVRDGEIISEGYNADNEMSTKQDVLSVTKSITSSLIGIAVNDKQIDSVDVPIANYYPELNANTDPRKKQISLSNLMTMTSGLSWSNQNEASSVAMTNSSDWVKYILNLPMAAQPGTQFVYNNGGVHLLSAILGKVTGMTEADYAKKMLFSPIGINDVVWANDPSGNSIGSFGLHMTARDMAKFGYLYLNNGVWDGNQIVPKQWIKDSLHQYLTFNDSNANPTEIGYGYLWWLREGASVNKMKTGQYDMYSADGAGGQRIFVMPDENMVAVFTANNPDPFFADSIVDDYLVPSIKSDKPLQPNPEGDKLLDEKVLSFKEEHDVN